MNCLGKLGQHVNFSVILFKQLVGHARSVYTEEGDSGGCQRKGEQRLLGWFLALASFPPWRFSIVGMYTLLFGVL